MTGFIAFSRGMSDHPALKNLNHFGVWALLVEQAKWPEGTITTTWATFSQYLGWNELSVKRCLRHFERTGMAALEADRRRVKVTIIDRQTFSLELSEGNGPGEIPWSHYHSKAKAVFGLERDYLPAKVRAAVFERDGCKCTYCGDQSGPFEVDHILAVINGGGNEIGNLTVACKPCNRSKSALPLEQWKAA